MREGTEHTHPSYGLVQITRSIGNRKRSLFGSSVDHSEAIRFEISRAVHHRRLSHDSYFARDHIVEFEMSPVQFAEAITGIGSGRVPCTFKWIVGEGNIPAPDFYDRQQKHVDEFKEAASEASDAFDGFRDAVARIKDKPNVTKADRTELLGLVQKIQSVLDSTLPFIQESFRESVDKVVHEAKGEFEAYVLHRALSIAEDGLKLVERPDQIEPPSITLQLGQTRKEANAQDPEA
jgi:hypothetical protein